MNGDFKRFKQTLLEYTFKDLNAIFGKFFDEFFNSDYYEESDTPTFLKLYDRFETRLSEFKKNFGLEERDGVIPNTFIINTYSKLKKHIEAGKYLYGDIGLFIQHFPILAFFFSYFNEFPKRFFKLKNDNSYNEITFLIEIFDKASFEEIAERIRYIPPSDIQYETVAINYILSTFISSKISPIYEDGEIVIYNPKNWVESRYLAADTYWCISSSTAKDHFKNYSEAQYEIYFIFKKGKGVRGKYSFLIKNIDNFDDKLKKIFERRSPPKPIFNKAVMDGLLKSLKVDFLLMELKNTYKDKLDFFLHILDMMKIERIPLHQLSFEVAYSSTVHNLQYPEKFIEALVRYSDLGYSSIGTTLKRPFSEMNAIDYIFKEKEEKKIIIEAIKSFFALEDGKYLLLLMNDYDYCTHILTNPNLEKMFYDNVKDLIPNLHKLIQSGEQYISLNREHIFEVRDYVNNVIKMDVIIDYIEKIENRNIQKLCKYYRQEMYEVDEYMKGLSAYISDKDLLKNIKFKSFNEIKEFNEIYLRFVHGDRHQEYSIFNEIERVRDWYDKKIKRFEELFIKSSSPEELYFDVLFDLIKGGIKNIIMLLSQSYSEHLYPWSVSTVNSILQSLSEGKRSRYYHLSKLVRILYDGLEEELKKLKEKVK